MAITRLSGGLTPGDGADPRTFPAIFNATADEIEAQGSAITTLENTVASQGSAITVIENWDLHDLNDVSLGTAVANGDLLAYSTAIPGWTNSAPGPVGKILQVVSTIKTGVYSVTQTTPIADVTDLEVTITPSSASSKVLLILDIGSMGHTDSGAGAFGRLYRGSTALNDSEWFVFFNSGNPGAAMSTHYLDSPATTSAVTYKVRVWSGLGTVRVNGIGATTSTLGVSKYTALEVGS